MGSPDFSWYKIGYCVCWVITFLVCYIYCVASYGFLLGVSLGWLPSAIAATIISVFWPVVVLGIVLIAAYIMNH
jgi:hypothetical protein